ncbi:aspartyl/asparaginyl beta-hydroxylase domain-containing protein [Myxococcus xanthus]|uniref:Aspartyl/asparaginyl beta-hydroxylase domain-containing protein n=1 Tax=Myxococcus xanthus TaxID=34 RepID=A0A7Y4IG73_MYXXA|nr:aspartyl/asparaginyl beta-hydroxylase domain-containing protein [Myxococcus xanthus]NOJ78290.1 aspartyl/asparaginyl beta-hydroxylase domain-containing protein [Myxococcus xanthus]NOJ85078.1 aspartyl/asparaginyl beta-hydroxylase domain-containing protein [Myxococcus xanthus]
MSTPVPDRLRLPFHFDVAPLQQELAALPAEAWVPHFNKREYEGEWSGVPLRSIGGMEGRIYPDPTGRERYADTPLLARCPALRAVLATFQCPIGAARLLKLAAGARIREHTDYNLGYADGEVRLHVPITTHPDVAFFLGGERVILQPGECWYLDFNRPHRVDNPSDTDRVHLVLDCDVNDWMRDVFMRAVNER